MENFERTERSITKEEISEFEQKNSFVLPESFIDHFLKNNVGFPPYNYVDGEEEVFSIDGFILFKYGKTTIEAILRNYSKQGIIFKNKLPFAMSENAYYLFRDIKNGEEDNEFDIYITHYRGTGIRKAGKNLNDVLKSLTSPDAYKTLLPFEQVSLPDTFTPLHIKRS